MRKPLTFIVVLALSALTAFAQTPNAEEKSTSQVQKAVALERLHEILRTHSNLHNEYGEIAAIGNEDSVPLLLERLRLDYGSAQRGDPSGAGMGFDCAQLHLIDALRVITNSDQGMYYPRWAAWWEAHRQFSQQRWIRDGFAIKGLQVAEPVDEQFGLELIETVGRDSGYLDFNALRLLAGVPPDQRAKWATQAAESGQRFGRLGAIRVSSIFALDGQDALLRRLTTDSDLEIRRLALTRLNDHLRVSLSATPGEARILGGVDKNNRVRGVCFIGELLVVAFRSGEVEAFDPRALSKRWSRRVFSAAGDQLLAFRDRVFLASRGGGVVALDNHGHVLWSNANDDESNEIGRLISNRDDLLVVRLGSVDRLDPNTGVTKSTVASHGLLTDADSTDSSAFFVDRRGLHSLQDLAALEPQFSTAVGISVNQQSVCVIVTAPEDRVTCLAPDSLSLQWTNKSASMVRGATASRQSRTPPRCSFPRIRN